jgi:hypothetical protein
MHSHQQQSIDNVIRYFEDDSEVLALLLGGSIAHGFETAESDVDVMIVVSDEVYERRVEERRLTFFSRELVTYPEGYVDGKTISPGFLQTIRERGSEPARFAFQDARILFSRIDDLGETLRGIVRYPVEHKVENIRRFRAQLEAWRWYCGEALKRSNRYLLALSTSKLILFGGRLLLAHNEQLYPYHKWFLRVLEGIGERPADLMDQIEQVATCPDAENVERFYQTIVGYREWEVSPEGWGTQFMLDNEWNWLDGKTPIDDV